MRTSVSRNAEGAWQEVQQSTILVGKEVPDMPAVTVDNPLALPRVSAAADAVARPVLTVTTAPKGYEGEGFPVRRAFAGINYRHLDPFIMMDQMGEVEYQPGEPKGTP